MHHRDTDVVSEAQRQIVVAPRLEKGERALQMITRFGELSGEPVRAPEEIMRDSGLGRIGPCLDVVEEALGMRPHCR